MTDPWQAEDKTKDLLVGIANLILAHYGEAGVVEATPAKPEPVEEEPESKADTKLQVSLASIRDSVVDAGFQRIDIEDLDKEELYKLLDAGLPVVPDEISLEELNDMNIYQLRLVAQDLDVKNWDTDTAEGILETINNEYGE